MTTDTFDSRVKRETKTVLAGRGLEISVPGDLTKPQAVGRLIAFAEDLISDLQGEAAERGLECLALTCSATRGALQLAGTLSLDLARDTAPPVVAAPEAEEEIEGPLGIACEDCSAKVGRPCVGLAGRYRGKVMVSYHNGRWQAL